MRRFYSLSGVLTAIGLLAATSAAAQVTKETVPGITNFAKVESTVACAGAITTEAVPEIKKMGFHSIINLRPASETGANVEANIAAAKAADIPYFHIPFSASSPDPAIVDQFLKAITTPGMEPAFIHWAGGGRAAGMWLIKRVMIDGWAIDRAEEEATALGLNPAMKKWILEQAQHARSSSGRGRCLPAAPPSSGRVR